MTKHAYACNMNSKYKAKICPYNFQQDKSRDEFTNVAVIDDVNICTVKLDDNRGNATRL